MSRDVLSPSHFLVLEQLECARPSTLGSAGCICCVRVKSYFSVWGATALWCRFWGIFFGAIARERSAMRLIVGKLSQDVVPHALIHFRQR